MIFLKYVVKGKLRLIKVGKQFEECAVNREVWLPSQSERVGILRRTSNEKECFRKAAQPLDWERCQNFSSFWIARWRLFLRLSSLIFLYSVLCLD